MSVSIVIPNWNGEEKLKRNLSKVLKVKDVDEIIVVDDGSTDGSVEVLKKDFPQIKLVELAKNHGFSTAVNSGVKVARSDYIFLLNTDTVPEVDCIEKVLKQFKENVFSVSANTGGSWSWIRWNKGFLWHYLADKTNFVHQTLWSSGGSGIFKKKIWNELEGLDELFNRFYEEDMDLGYRSTKRGYINIWDPNFIVEHYQEPGVIAQNFNKSHIARIAQRNQLYVIWKNIHDKKLVREHIRFLIIKLLTSPKYWPVFLSAFIHLPKILKLRRIEKTSTKITDEEIFNKFN